MRVGVEGSGAWVWEVPAVLGDGGERDGSVRDGADDASKKRSEIRRASRGVRGHGVGPVGPYRSLDMARV